MARNRYHETPARAAECLRQALSLMTRQPTRPHPLSYAVWYEHVSGHNAALSAEIERITAGGGQLDEQETERLYRTHVLELDMQATQRVAAGFRSMLGEVVDSARHAGQHAEQFESALERWQQDLANGAGQDATRCEAMQADTRGMRDAVAVLQTRLQATRDEVDRLQRELDHARAEALRDSLTGLANRRAFDLQLAACLDKPLALHSSLLLIDIDHFKRVNDSHGHLFGDQVLKAVAQGIQSCVSLGQLVARVGGEEFAILLPQGGTTAAQLLAEKIRATVAASRIRRRDGGGTIGQVTVSVGLSALRSGDTPDTAFERADRALYAAKHAGRNRVTVAA
ncbi:MAG: diguanylate cyclase [Rubrivivax sp.]|nr:diguanylate cyclase [Rubrivivax sp.]